MRWRSREKSWRENKMRLQTKKTCCSKTWVCFYSKAVREFYTDMKDVPTDHPDFQRAIKVLAFGNIANLRGPPWRPVKKAHASGGGIKPQSSGNSFCIFFFFFWFVNVREALKGRLPKHLFKLKLKELYAKWLIQNPTRPENQLQFGSQWIK